MGQRCPEWLHVPLHFLGFGESHKERMRRALKQGLFPCSLRVCTRLPNLPRQVHPTEFFSRR